MKCQAILKTGQRTGQKCGKTCKPDSQLCCMHFGKYVISKPEPILLCTIDLLWLSTVTEYVTQLLGNVNQGENTIDPSTQKAMILALSNSADVRKLIVNVSIPAVITHAEGHSIKIWMDDKNVYADALNSNYMELVDEPKSDDFIKDLYSWCCALQIAKFLHP